MSKLVLSDVTNINSITTINANFEKIQEELQEKVLYRDNPDGEPNHMLDNLDMNGNKIINAGEVRVGSLVINGVPVEPTTGVTTASAFQVYEYTATEGQTTFSVAPHTPFVSSLQVEVNGLSYPPSGYDVSGTDVIIPSANAGDEVVIRRFVNAPTTIPTAEDITFILDSPGAVPRTMREKAGDTVSVKDFGAVGDGVTDDTAAIQAALSFGYTSGSSIYIPPGTYIVGSTLSPQAGVRMFGDNGRLTGSARKTIIKTSAALNPIIDASNLKYGYLGGFNLDGGGVAVSGVKGTNVFGLVMENMRATSFTDTGFELKNDGTGVGCYSNIVRKCVADACTEAGFRLNSSGGDVNHNLFEHCTATDTKYGFIESGTFGGRSNTYSDCNTERCSIRGMEINTTAFNIRGGYHEFNNTNILIDNANVVAQQGGIISGVSMLGSYGFPGAPNAYLTVGIQVNSSENVTIDSVWYAYLKTGNSLTGATKNTQIRNPFFNRSNVETFLSDSAGVGTLVTSGGQVSRRINGAAGNITASPSYGEVIYVDNGNANYTVTLNVTQYELGQGHEIMTLMSSGNTGTVTISDSTGATFFGQSGGSRVSGVTSLSMGRGDVCEVRKAASNQWFVKWANSQP